MSPTAVDVEPATNGGHAIVLATGVAAAMMAVVMFVALTPPRSHAPTALSATTLPALSVQMRASATQSTDRETTARDTQSVRFGSTTISRGSAVALIGSPNAVSASPSDPWSLDVAQQLPDHGDRVFILTQSHTFAVRWSQIGQLIAPDGSAVITADGTLIANFVGGELRILVD